MRALAVLGLVVTTSFACKPGGPRTADSELLFGHLNEIRYPGRLILATPGSTISFCGDFTSEAVNATRQWATAAGRASRLTIDANCTSTPYQWRITNFQNSQADCRRHFPNGDAGAYTDITQKHIAFCTAANDSNALGTMLHEIGHAWGMCDQYAQNAGNGNSNNCDPTHNSPGGKVSASVMGANYAHTLAQDDTDGIRALAARADVPGADQWRNAAVSPSTTPAAQPQPPRPPQPSAPAVQPPRPPQQAPAVTPSSSGSGLLDCNADFSKITAGGSGTCVNRSSGYAFCYRYANGNVQYQQNITCPSSGTSPQVSAPTVQPPQSPRPQPQPSAPSVQPPSPPPSSGGPLVACGCLQDVSGQCFLTKGTQKISIGGPTGSCAQTCVNKAAQNGCRY